MEKSAPSDPELLADWLGWQREPAFHALVARYAGLVHATAKRTCGDDSMAAEASQLTFIALAQKAKSLTSCASLGGWLHTTAIMQAKNLSRKSQRENRKRQLIQAAMETEPSHTSSDAWQKMQPVLDDALAALSDKDREALLLRFYRSLSIREIGETLGIATDAAQKRIDRATERLRGKLARRGCQAGGSLGTVMVAGFAADAQAAVPAISFLTSKALAAGVVSTSGLAKAFTLITTTAMKNTSMVPALVALFAAGAWIASQRQSIATVEQQNAILQNQLVAGATAVSAISERTSSIRSELDKQPIDWNEVARQLDTGEGAGGYLRSTLRLEEGFLAMTREQLIAALDEIDASNLPVNYRSLLEDWLIGPLIEKDPESALKRYFDRVYVAGSNQIIGQYANALSLWAKKEPEKAVAWCDEQIAAGKFDSNSVKGNLYVRIQLEGAMTSVLLAIDPPAAVRRLAALPGPERINVLRGDSFGRAWRNPEVSLAFANLLRQQLPEKDHLDAITWPVTALGEGGTIEFSAMHDYLKLIEATSAELDACILGMARRGTFPRKSGDFFETTNDDLDALRAWVGTEAPELTERAIVSALKGLSQNLNYPDAAALALHCHATSGSDEVLLPLLKDYEAAANKDLARTLAGKLTDEKQRKEYLKKFK